MILGKLIRRLVPLQDAHALPPIAAAMVLQTISMLSACIAQGRMSRAQARDLVLRLARLEFQESDFPRNPR